jgi:hypothetical protein
MVTMMCRHKPHLDSLPPFNVMTMSLNLNRFRYHNRNYNPSKDLTSKLM